MLTRPSVHYSRPAVVALVSVLVLFAAALITHSLTLPAYDNDALDAEIARAASMLDTPRQPPVAVIRPVITKAQYVDGSLASEPDGADDDDDDELAHVQCTDEDGDDEACQYADDDDDDDADDDDDDGEGAAPTMFSSLPSHAERLERFRAELAKHVRRERLSRRRHVRLEHDDDDDDDDDGDDDDDDDDDDASSTRHLHGDGSETAATDHDSNSDGNSDGDDGSNDEAVLEAFRARRKVRRAYVLNTSSPGDADANVATPASSAGTAAAAAAAPSGPAWPGRQRYSAHAPTVDDFDALHRVPTALRHERRRWGRLMAELWPDYARELEEQRQLAALRAGAQPSSSSASSSSSSLRHQMDSADDYEVPARGNALGASDDLEPPWPYTVFMLATSKSWAIELRHALACLHSHGGLVRGVVVVCTHGEHADAVEQWSDLEELYVRDSPFPVDFYHFAPTLSSSSAASLSFAQLVQEHPEMLAVPDVGHSLFTSTAVCVSKMWPFAAHRTAQQAAAGARSWDEAQRLWRGSVITGTLVSEADSTLGDEYVLEAGWEFQLAAMIHDAQRVEFGAPVRFAAGELPRHADVTGTTTLEPAPAEGDTQPRRLRTPFGGAMWVANALISAGDFDLDLSLAASEHAMLADVFLRALFEHSAAADATDRTEARRQLGLPEATGSTTLAPRPHLIVCGTCHVVPSRYTRETTGTKMPTALQQLLSLPKRALTKFLHRWAQRTAAVARSSFVSAAELAHWNMPDGGATHGTAAPPPSTAAAGGTARALSVIMPFDRIGDAEIETIGVLSELRFVLPVRVVDYGGDVPRFRDLPVPLWQQEMLIALQDFSAAEYWEPHTVLLPWHADRLPLRMSIPKGSRFVVRAAASTMSLPKSLASALSQSSAVAEGDPVPVSAVLVPSSFSEIVLDAAGVDACTVRVLPGVVDTHRHAPRFGKPVPKEFSASRPFRFGAFLPPHSEADAASAPPEHSGWKELVRAYIAEFAHDEPVELRVFTDAPRMAFDAFAALIHEEADQRTIAVPRITFHVAPVAADLPAALDDLDAVVFPHRTCAFPHAALHAMAQHRVVIAGAFGGCADVLHDTFNALVARHDVRATVERTADDDDEAHDATDKLLSGTKSGVLSEVSLADKMRAAFATYHEAPLREVRDNAARSADLFALRAVDACDSDTDGEENGNGNEFENDNDDNGDRSASAATGAPSTAGAALSQRVREYAAAVLLAERDCERAAMESRLSVREVLSGTGGTRSGNGFRTRTRTPSSASSQLLSDDDADNSASGNNDNGVAAKASQKRPKSKSKPKKKQQKKKKARDE